MTRNIESVRHHPDQATLMAYAAGAMTEGFNLVVAAHLEFCAQCRHQVAEAEAIGGALLHEIEQDATPPGGLDDVWQRINKQPEQPPTRRTIAPRDDGMPRVLEPYLPHGLAGVNWKRLVPGIRHHQFRELDNGAGTLRLFAIAPGTSIPQHGHNGSELTLVLKGSYGDEIGRFRHGDLADLDDGVQHQPVADTAEPCICLIATDDRLKFNDLFSRMLQPLVGI